MKTGTIKQYRPAYFSGFENKENTFNSLEELLSIDWVGSFKKLLTGEINPEFYQYSISESFNYNLLVAEYENGNKWYVIGIINKNDIIKELPIFTIKCKKTDSIL